MTTALTPDTSESWQVLRRAGELTGPRIRQALDRLAEPVRTVARYHFGWCDAAGRHTDDGWGKGLRGALVLGGAQALGATPGRALGAAAAVELVHNFSVLHDDVMDQDATRRGRPTAWTVFGSAQALLAGDALLVLAMEELASSPSPVRHSTSARELCRALLELVAGQSSDLAFEERADVDLEECLAMAAGKTAALFAGACGLGALAADGGPAQVEALRGFGHHLGLAFQLVDDLLGIWGDTRATGKPVGADLHRRKKSLPVVAALRSDTPAGRRLAELYHDEHPLKSTGVAHATTLVEQAGGRDWALAEAARQRTMALGRLAEVTLDPQAAQGLRSLVDLAMHRSS
ncbi:polyprenyl synthetase family protein [Streptomyces sp. NBS 14/10]|uniref:polyprenyl synthetase family protein n=1 Tax=Streptomyces sp. NBS 14/10 TaxID=1945643 RepID=UPI000B7E3E43|nr:polyprenyl synthetase family protein [Streptomyces sp. NBS 14/10]KAK1182388.1 polyprenyl synthetase family protein [Streptomyces sp. NBS 14/10]